ncbi:endonuclease III domain-containing protein [Halorarius halobius]|uniref:endonuclease III domain-containing protein n=1 Tax=Halorarius halobius TaxID=2962671 RepID=UPI0020CD7524|nr:endonuclease III [Halorarius halobius]
MDDEPAENISGGESGGGTAASFAPGEADTHAEAVVDRLGDIYWQKTYGGQQAFECLVRTILSQNTSDTASQPAHDSLMERYGASEPRSGSDSRAGDARETGDLAASLAEAEQSELAETIASAGLYNQKSETIIRLAGRVVDEYGGVSDSSPESDGRETEPRPAEGFDAFVTESDPGVVRETLLDMTGVGPKTADCVLLFSGGRTGVFPVDTHVHRIARRMGLAPADADHETVREHLERDVPAEKCGFGHTAMIQFGRDYCTARTPACLDDPEACPLADACDQVGVYPASGEVVDPSEAPERE